MLICHPVTCKIKSENKLISLPKTADRCQQSS